MDTKSRKEKQRLYVREVWYPSNKKKHIEVSASARRKRRERCVQAVHELKKAPCSDCHQTFPPVCMDFDHLPGKKKIATVAMLTSGASPMARILEEIAKCDLVCSNCHRIRTAERRIKRV